jgi:hypothetical protein
MKFGEALELLKHGKAITRQGWNGKGMHVVISKLYTPDNLQIANDCLLLFNVNKQYNTWIPSITDLFAEDWQVVQ